jgi:carbon storage regulator CsrA
MLVLRRRAGDSLMIGDVEVEILEITPTRVKLGILAPDTVPIVRKEVQLTREQNVTAAKRVDPHAVSWLTGKLTKS